MSEEDREEVVVEEPVSEVSENDVHEQEVDSNESSESEVKEQTVPLTAYTAERKKRQETEKQNQLLSDYVNQLKEGSESPEEDPEDWVTNSKFDQRQSQTKQEIMEEVYLQMNTDALPKINKYLDKIIEKKPWLADSVKNAPNRYARAYEIIQDYEHVLDSGRSRGRSDTAKQDAARIAENAKKPKSPVAVGKSVNMSNAEYLKSIAGTKDFRDYRQKVRRGEI
jgi:hypothetical protein